MSQPVASSLLRRARVGDSFVFFLVGFVYSSFAVRLPAVKAELGIGDGQLALAFVGLNAGAILGLQLGSISVPRTGSRATLRFALPLFSIMLLGPALAGNLLTLTAALFLFATMNSVVDVGMNAQGVLLQEGYGRPVMSSLHAMHPIGLVAGSAVGALAAHLDVARVLHLSTTGIACAVMSFAVGLMLLPSQRDAEPSAERPSPLSRSELSRGWTKPIVLLGLLAFCCTLADGAALEWTAVYLHDSLGASQGTAAVGFTVFAAALAIGRVSGDPLTSRFGPVHLFRAGVLLAGCGWGAALLLSSREAAFGGLALLGIGLSYALPLSMAAAGKVPGQPAAVAAARVGTLAYLGSFTGPALIGFVAERLTLAAALGAPAIIVAVTAFGAGRLAPAQVRGGEVPARRRRSRRPREAPRP